MGYGKDSLCYCSNYLEKGEWLYFSQNSVNISRNNSSIINIHYSPNNEGRIDDSINLFRSFSNNNDNSFSQLDSRILENIDNLAPEKRRCIICLENFQKFNKIINLSCLHMFHDDCIKKWLKNQNYCPICKNEIQK